MDYGQMAQWLAGLRRAQAAPMPSIPPVAQPQERDGLPPTTGAVPPTFPNVMMSEQDAMMKARPGTQWNPVATPGMMPSWSAGVGVPNGMDRSYLPSQMQGLFKGNKGK